MNVASTPRGRAKGKPCPHCGQALPPTPVEGKTTTPAVICSKCRRMVFLEEPPGTDAEFSGTEPEAQGPLPTVDRFGPRQAKRYLILVLIMFVAVVAYQIIQAVGESDLLNQSREAVVRRALNRVVVAQEAYYQQYGTYAQNLDQLPSPPEKNVEIVVKILKAGSGEWSGKAYHLDSRKGYLFSSNRQGALERFERQEKGRRTAGRISSTITLVDKE